MKQPSKRITYPFDVAKAIVFSSGEMASWTIDPSCLNICQLNETRESVVITLFGISFAKTQGDRQKMYIPPLDAPKTIYLLETSKQVN